MYSILFRCDGGPEIGLGHVVRCLALADELKQRHACEVEFAVIHGPTAWDLIARAGFKVYMHGEGFSAAREADWIQSLVSKSDARMIVADVRQGLDPRGLLALRRRGVAVTLLDDSSSRRLAADLAFYPPMDQFDLLNWRGSVGHHFVGWDWVVLRSQFRNQMRLHEGNRPTVLVSAGGSDPAGITTRLIDALELVERDMEPIVILGSAFGKSVELAARLRSARRPYRVLTGVTEIAALMAQAHLALISFGMTAYELAAMGVPAIYVALSDDHAESAATFQRAGLGVNLGVYDRVQAESIAAAVQQLLDDPARRTAMSSRGRMLIDGHGVERVAAQIVRFLRRRCGQASQVA